MNKKGQVALWFIIGLIILILVFIGFYYRENILDFLHERNLFSTETIPREVEPINNFILDCVHQVGEEAISFVSFYGGYYNTSNVQINERGIPYYLIDGKIRIPSKEFIQNSLALYINNNLKDCTNNFVDFNKSFLIAEGSVRSRVNIDSGKISFFVKYPVSLKKGEFQYNLKYFNVDVNNNLDNVYATVVKVINEQSVYNDICLSCLYNVSVANNLTTEVYNPVLHEVEYTFVDNQFKILNDSYKFTVALRLE